MKRLPTPLPPRPHYLPQGRVILGDVITAIDGKKIESPNDMYLALEKYKVGDAVSVTSLRDGRTVQTKVTLDPVQ
jgi:S1-C subfamily serine protease